MRHFCVVTNRCASAEYACVHIINGLPGEDREMMLETARELARLHVFSVKIHLLHIMRGTRLADRYEAGGSFRR